MADITGPTGGTCPEGLDGGTYENQIFYNNLIVSHDSIELINCTIWGSLTLCDSIAFVRCSKIYDNVIASNSSNAYFECCDLESIIATDTSLTLENSRISAGLTSSSCDDYIYRCFIHGSGVSIIGDRSLSIEENILLGGLSVSDSDSLSIWGNTILNGVVISNISVVSVWENIIDYLEVTCHNAFIWNNDIFGRATYDIEFLNEWVNIDSSPVFETGEDIGFYPGTYRLGESSPCPNWGFQYPLENPCSWCLGGMDIGFHYPIATACIPCEEESKFTLIASSYGPIY
jgi:hypothetical protein